MEGEDQIHQEEVENIFQRRYRAPHPSPNETNLLLEPHLHLSNKRLRHEEVGSDDLKRRGAPTKVAQWWDLLTPWQQSIVENAGLGGLVQLCRFRKLDKAKINALAERWWDTTNTFHLPLGEVTLTPLDLYMLTGLQCRGSKLQYDFGLYQRENDVNILLGSNPPPGPSVALSWFDSQFPVEDANEAQVVRGFIIFLLGHTIFSNTGSTVHLYHLGYQLDLNRIGECDFGGATLAMLYRTMCDLSRDSLRSTPGFSWIWEGWMYELLNMNVPYKKNRLENDPNIFPRLKRWYTGQCTQWSLMDYRRELDNLTYGQVKWDAWENSPYFRLADGQAALAMSSARLLVEGPCWYFWYLGERVTAQWLDSHAQIVPAPPPQFMRKPSLINDDEFILEAMRGLPAMNFVNPEINYEVFRTYALRGPLINGHIFPIPEVHIPPPEPVVNAPRSSMRWRSTSARHSNVTGDAASSEAHMIQLSWMVPSYNEQTDELGVETIERPEDLDGPPLPENITRVSRAEYDESRSLISGLKKKVSKLTLRIRDLTMCSRAKDVELMARDTRMMAMAAEQEEMRRRLARYEEVPSTSRRRRSTSDNEASRSSSASHGEGSFLSNLPLSRVASRRRQR